MNKQIMLAGLFAVFLLSSVALATPGLPHQFYGTIYINSVAAPDNTVLIASIETDEYSTITTSSYYGKSPSPIFYVPDPDRNRKGDTIYFSIGGMPVGTHDFEDCYEQGNCYDEINFNITTECGDGYCLGDETCDSCSDDCGECPVEPFNIYIHSPAENEVYDSTHVPLEVSSNQEIMIWWYTLNSEGATVFTPNTTINAEEGENQIFVFAKNYYGQVGSNMVFNFSVELPEIECGNGVKEEGEECDGTDLGISTCSSYGFNSGTLSCSAECTIVITDCRNVVDSTPPPVNTGGTGGGGGGGYVPPPDKENETDDDNETSTQATGSTASDGEEETLVCLEDWVCSGWDQCEDGIQARNCVDVNNCGTEDNMPFETQPCSLEEAQSSTPTGLAFLTALRNPYALAIIALLFAVLIGVGLKKGRIKV